MSHVGVTLRSEGTWMRRATDDSAVVRRERTNAEQSLRRSGVTDLSLTLDISIIKTYSKGDNTRLETREEYFKITKVFTARAGGAGPRPAVRYNISLSKRNMEGKMRYIVVRPGARAAALATL
ncbi:unnamed protein product [Spodoptera exigua]|nr:unnamed protein product [Spodoptera exigua]